MTIITATGTGTSGSSSTSSSSTSTSKSSATGSTMGIANDNLGKDAFLKLLVAQLKYQNPLSPMDGSAFIAQTAQLTMTESLQTMATLQQNTYADSAKRTATELVGRTVVYEGGDGKEIEGDVTAARMYAGSPVLLIGKKEIPLDAVIEVRSTVASSSAAARAAALPVTSSTASSTTSSTTSPTTAATATTATTTSPATTATTATAPPTTSPNVTVTAVAPPTTTTN